MEHEMCLLQEKFTEMKQEGEIFLGMDGNAKLGILGEIPSRNGKLMQKVIDNTNLTLMNTSPKCTGKITRKNMSHDNEYSAIDFILVSDIVEKWIESVVIDEDGLSTVCGKKTSDHSRERNLLPRKD